MPVLPGMPLKFLSFPVCTRLPLQSSYLLTGAILIEPNLYSLFIILILKSILPLGSDKPTLIHMDRAYFYSILKNTGTLFIGNSILSNQPGSIGLSPHPHLLPSRRRNYLILLLISPSPFGGGFFFPPLPMVERIKVRG